MASHFLLRQVARTVPLHPLNHYLSPNSAKSSLNFVSPIICLAQCKLQSSYLSNLSHRLFSSAANSASQSTKDYYQVLGVSRNATSAQIKKAYYALAKNHHPDKSGGDPELFSQVNSAYEALSDPKKRRIYDRFGEDGLRAAATGANPDAASGFSESGGSATVDDFLREFTDMFSSQRVSRAKPDDPVPGDNKQTSATLTLREAAFGVLKTLRSESLDSCGDCSGTGKTASTKQDTCPICGGSGRVQNSFGMFQAVMDCQRCDGMGAILRNPCNRCNGSGVRPSVKQVSVSFPPGCDTGMVLRVPGGGDTGARSGPPGDLFVQVKILEDPYFHRVGRDLHVVAPISMAQAALGGDISVKTLDGEETVPVKPGTQSDDTVILHGRALRGVKSPKRGDQIVHFKVVVPNNVSGRQKQLLVELMELEGGKNFQNNDVLPRSLLQRFQRFLRRNVSSR